MRALLLTTLFVLGACNQQAPEPPVSEEPAVADPAPAVADPAHNSRNALDWPGTYEGILPCADCEGIRTTIRLQADGAFMRELAYLGKDDGVVRDNGRFAWTDAGSVITLAPDSAEAQQYQVGENVLFHLDKSGQRITGDLADRYRLLKAPRDPNLEDRRWVLVEIMGQPFAASPDGREAFIRFDGDQSSLNGNNSCNNFFGAYVLQPGSRIRIGDNLGSTMMACPDMETEAAFMDALRRIDNYATDGNYLSLNRARMAPLLRFEAAEDGS